MLRDLLSRTPSIVIHARIDERVDAVVANLAIGELAGETPAEFRPKSRGS